MNKAIDRFVTRCSRLERIRPTPSLAWALGLALIGCGDSSSGTGGSPGGGTDSAAESGSGDTGGSTGGGGLEFDLDPAPGGMRRLMGFQYTNAVRDLLGEAAAAASRPPADRALYDYDAIGAAQLALSDADVDNYEVSARRVVEAAISDLSTLAQTAPCVANDSPEDDCYDEVARDLGDLAWRRPLTAAELERLGAIGRQARAWGEGEFLTGLRYELMAILQSPHFLYIVGVGEPDEETGLRRLKPRELATRMSFFLVGSTPSAELLDAADEGSLDTEEGIYAAARELVRQRQARDAVSTFYDEYLHLRDLPSVGKNLEVFPEFTDELAAAMRSESLRLIEDVVWERGVDAREMFTADYTFANQDLAGLYGVTVEGDGFERIEFPAEQGRGGVLGQAAFLARFSHPAGTSPTRRGHFIQAKILCNEIPAPPPNVEASVPEFDDSEPKTLRQRLERHLEDKSCSGCHVPMDTVGFGFENYDPIGRYRTVDLNGLELDSLTDAPSIGVFRNAAEFGQLLLDDVRVTECMVKSLFRQSMGHLETSGERDALDQLYFAFEDNGHLLPDLLVEIAASPAFTFVGEPR